MFRDIFPVLISPITGASMAEALEPRGDPSVLSTPRQARWKPDCRWSGVGKC